MAVHAAAGANRRGAPQTSEFSVFPAPVLGMDARINVAANNLEICIVAENMIPSQYGLKVRPGYRTWQEGLGSEVRTVIPFTGELIDRTEDRIFVATEDGIYDVTTDGGTPVQKIAFLDTTGDAGFGVYAHYVDGSATDTLFYADGQNGLFAYDPGTDTWAIATGIQQAAGTQGTFNIADVVFVVAHKLRVWFVTKNDTIGWYLPILSSQGDVNPFFFGAKFKHGGELVGLYNWTLDGGDGVDDKLVAISRAGDVIPYQGDDPTTQNWQNIGTFFIGAMPRGNRVCSEYGGNLFMLSSLGLSSMAELVRGAEIESPTPDSIGFKIARLLRLDLAQYSNEQGWDLKFVTSEGLMMISVPQRIQEDYRQYVYNLSTRGWGLWNAVPLLSSDPWLGDLMVGTKDGKLLRMDVDADQVENDGSGGVDINWYVLSSYTDFGQPGVFKQVTYIRPNFSATLPPSVQCQAAYDFSTTEPLPVVPSSPDDGSLYGTAQWGQSSWGSAGLKPQFELQGAGGLGRTVAIVMVGSSQSETFLGSWDIAWRKGGFT